MRDVFSFFEGMEGHGYLTHLDANNTPVDGLEALLEGVDFNSNNAILKVFDQLGKYLVIDRNWANTLKKYVYGFVTRKTAFTDHMEFFGSPYVGLHKIAFTTADRNEWFSEVFDCDEEELKENLHAVKAIEKDWNVVGDAFNMSIPYLMYRVHHSGLDSRTKEQALIDIVAMYHYKCLTSIMNNDYPYLARKEVAMETYNRLSLKYDIKRYGSWHKLFVARAEFIINPRTGVHYKTFTEMNDDKKIVYMVGDIQNRLRRVMNEINKVFHEVKDQTNIMSFDNAKVSLGDELTLKTVNKEINSFVSYIDRVLTEETSFYKEELVTYTSGVMEAMPKDKLEYIIKEIPTYYNNPRNKNYHEFIETIILHMFDYLHQHGVKRTNVYDVLIKMRGAYAAPLSKNEQVLFIRKEGDKIVKEQTGIKTQQTVQLLRTGLCLYIVLRVLSRDYYN